MRPFCAWGTVPYLAKRVRLYREAKMQEPVCKTSAEIWSRNRSFGTRTIAQRPIATTRFSVLLSVADGDLRSGSRISSGTIPLANRLDSQDTRLFPNQATKYSSEIRRYHSRCTVHSDHLHQVYFCTPSLHGNNWCITFRLPYYEQLIEMKSDGP